jgi:hypothetical protein
VGEDTMTASDGFLIELGFVAPGNRVSVLDFSEEQAAASGNQSKGSDLHSVES